MLQLTPQDLDAPFDDHSLEIVDDTARGAVEAVSHESQHGYIGTWLAKHLQGEQTVHITKNDRNEHPDIDFDAALAIIDTYKTSIATLIPIHPSFRTRVLDDIRATVAANRLTHAIVSKETEGVKRALVLAGFAGVSNQVLQHFTGLNPLVYALSSTLDNGLAIIGEADKLRRQGFSLKDAWSAMKVPGGLLATAIGASIVVDSAFDAGQRTFAGATYGLESTICVTPSLAAALTTLRQEYYQLVLEGKVVDPALEALLKKDHRSWKEEVETFVQGSRLALKHDLIYPHHAGLYAGATIGLLLSTILANVPMGHEALLRHPYVLAPLGIADSLGGAVAGAADTFIYDLLLKRDLRRLTHLYNKQKK